MQLPDQQECVTWEQGTDSGYLLVATGGCPGQSAAVYEHIDLAKSTIQHELSPVHCHSFPKR